MDIASVIILNMDIASVIILTMDIASVISLNMDIASVIILDMDIASVIILNMDIALVIILNSPNFFSDYGPASGCIFQKTSYVTNLKDRSEKKKRDLLNQQAQEDMFMFSDWQMSIHFDFDAPLVGNVMIDVRKKSTGSQFACY